MGIAIARHPSHHRSQTTAFQSKLCKEPPLWYDAHIIPPIPCKRPFMWLWDAPAIVVEADVIESM